MPTSEHIPEPDWKYMRSLQSALLERYCARVNARTAAILMDPQLSHRERYGQVFGHVRDSDRVVADCFDDWRRSKLVFRICCLRAHDIITPEEYAGLSEETRRHVDALLEIFAEQAKRAEGRRRR